MAVAWIGNRETAFEPAAEQAAALLHSSRCPVITIDTDIHGTRAAIMLAERVGAAYDHPDAAALARETALFTDSGGMFIAPGETRRRADVLTVVGALPPVQHDFVAELAASSPDLGGVDRRRFFLVGDTGFTLPSGAVTVEKLSCGGVRATLAALRAQCRGRKVATPVAGFDAFSAAIAVARFPVFLFSGISDGLALEMLHGLIADLNEKRRAAALFLPQSESGWGSTLASTWCTGFPMRTGLARGFPEYDPWRFDVARMIEAGEADLHLRIAGSRDAQPASHGAVPFIALEKTSRPIAGAEVTIAIGRAGLDHDAVLFSGRTGSLVSARAEQASGLPSAAQALRAICALVLDGDAAEC